MKRATFLDLDRFINRIPPEGQYTARWEEMQFLPGAAEVIGLLGGVGCCVIVVSNQKYVAEELLTFTEFVRGSKVSKSISGGQALPSLASGRILTYVFYREISTVLVMERQGAHAGFRVDHHALAKLHADLFRFQELPDSRLVLKVGARRIVETVALAAVARSVLLGHT